MKINERNDVTTQFLRLYSNKISSRANITDLEYRVVITKDDIYVYPDTWVYPNTHKRKESDKRSILSYILTALNISNSDLDVGTYVYESSINGRKRRWRKVR